MRILLTNDDGIYAEGIQTLYGELRKVGDVTVAAPDGERSSVGHGITLAHPLWVKKVRRNGKFFGYGISGTPADCVKCAVGVILKEKPDLVVSGINVGGNEGCSVFYSGTVAGAREGALMGIPALALSLSFFDQPDFRYAAKLGARLAKMIIGNGIPRGVFLNVNIPNKPSAQMKGIKVARQGTDPIHGEFRRRKAPDGRDYYWMTGKNPPLKKDLGIDINALHRGYVTVTPIKCDITDDLFLEDLRGWKF